MVLCLETSLWTSEGHGEVSYILAFYSDVQSCVFHTLYLNRSEWMNQSVSDGWRFWLWPWEALRFMEPLNFYYEELFRQVKLQSFTLGRKEIFLQFLFITYYKSDFAMTDFDISSWASKPPWCAASPSKFSKAGFPLQVLPLKLLGGSFAYPCMCRAQNWYKNGGRTGGVGDRCGLRILSLLKSLPIDHKVC